MLESIAVSYKSTNSAVQAALWLRKLPNIVALDFEAASSLSDEDKQTVQEQLDTDLPFYDALVAKQQLLSDGLSHPSLSRITHMSLAHSVDFGYVFIIDNLKIEQVIMKWLVTTTIKQIWHNASFDFKLIYYRTGKMPINFEDTQQYAKTLINDCNNQKSKTGLKDLMGHKYGAWAVAAENFNAKFMYEPSVLKYAATDACATYNLYLSILQSKEDTTDEHPIDCGPL